jgi:hypothetical protein
MAQDVEDAEKRLEVCRKDETVIHSNSLDSTNTKYYHPSLQYRYCINFSELCIHFPFLQEKNAEMAAYLQQSKAKQDELEAQFAAQVSCS